MKVVIIAELTAKQLTYVKDLAAQEGIQAEYFESQEEEKIVGTPITGEVIDEAASLLGKTPLEITQWVVEEGISTVEEAVQKVSPEVRDLLGTILL